MRSFVMKSMQIDFLHLAYGSCKKRSNSTVCRNIASYNKLFNRISSRSAINMCLISINKTNAMYSKSYSSSSPLTSSYSNDASTSPYVDTRDVLVVDHNYDMNRFLNCSATPMYFRHITSQHMAAEYLRELYRNSDYNFSSIGEYSLNLTAVHAYRTNVILSPSDKMNSNHKHSIYIWPEGIVIHNLNKSDIASICKVIGKSDRIKLKEFASRLSAGIYIEDITNKLVVVSSVSKVSSPKSALQVLKWFEIARLIDGSSNSQVNNSNRNINSNSNSNSNSDNNSNSNSNRSKEVDLLVAAELREHRQKSSVLILPADLSFDSLDTFDRVKLASKQASR